jgi:hypothetical protein
VVFSCVLLLIPCICNYLKDQEIIFPAIGQQTMRLSENTRFANFQSIVDVSRFDLSNPTAVNLASIKGLMIQTPTLIMDLNRDSSRLF